MSSMLVLEPTQPLIQWVLGVLSRRVKQPACEADHELSTSAEVNVGLCIYKPMSSWQIAWLVKHKNNLHGCLLS
jgi:hypothetical protein